MSNYCPNCNCKLSKKSNFCPNCGNQAEISQPKDNVRKKSLPVIIGITSVCAVLIITIAVYCIVNYTNLLGYNYNVSGIYGFDTPIKWDMTRADFESLDLDCENIKSDENYILYKDIKFENKFTGTLYIGIDTDNDTIKEMSFTFDDKKTDNICDSICDTLGEPVHKDNFNNARIENPKWVWLYSKNQYVILEKITHWDYVKLTWEICDTDKVKQARDTLEYINSNSTLKTTYETLLQRSRYIDASIEDAIKDLSLTKTEIVEGFKSSYLVHELNTVNFLENSELFGYKGTFKYHCENPYSDSPPDFYGKIEYIKFDFDSELSDKQVDELNIKINAFLGRTDEDDATSYIPFLISCDEKCINLHKNEDYYKYNPQYDNDDSTEKVEAYADCNPDILKLDCDYDAYYVSLYSDAAEKCWKIATERVKNNLKSPSTANFPNLTNIDDVIIKRTGNKYEVFSYVDAQNSFGATVRTYFVVKVDRNGRSYSVSDINFKKR